MFLKVWNFIVLIQLLESGSTFEGSEIYEISKPLHKKDTQSQELSDFNNANLEPMEEKLFESIHEVSERSSSCAHSSTRTYNREETLDELKTILLKVLCKLDNLENVHQGSVQRNINNNNHMVTVKEVTEELIPKKVRNGQNVKKRTRWDNWTQWSSCSVTCGKGREIRWRHCLEKCDTAETEMEEKSCQLPACAPKHMFGFPY